MIIEWTLASKEDYWKNIEYLENNWSEKEVLNFIKDNNICFHIHRYGGI